MKNQFMHKHAIVT